MSDIIITQNFQNLVQQWLESDRLGNKFPIDFDDVWMSTGYSRKDSAKRILGSKNLNKHYITIKSSTKTKCLEKIHLSIEGFIYFLVGSNKPEANNIVLDIFTVLLKLQLEHFDTNKDPRGFVYLINQVGSDLYKIGKAKNPIKRLETLQVGSAIELKIIERIFSFDAVKLEKKMQDYYTDKWVRGEWYRLTDDDVENFLSVANEFDKDSEVLMLPSS